VHPIEDSHEIRGRNRLSQEVFGARADCQAHGLGIGRRPDDDQGRPGGCVTGIPGGELRQVLGIESQHHQIRIKRDPMEWIGVPVTDEPGMHFILAASGKALLQGPKRRRSARCDKNSYH